MRVFLTGAANGIGKAAAEELVDRDHKVIAFDSDGEGLQQLPDSVETYQGDVRNSERLKEVMKGEIFEVLVNCAGIQRQGAVEDMNVDEFEEQMDVNYLGTLRAVKAALPMIKQRDGRIINVSSVAGLYSTPFLGAYSASKHAVEGLTDSLRMELKNSGVEVVLVEPGPIQTGFNERGRKNLEKYLPGSDHSSDYRRKLEKDYQGAEPVKPARTIIKAIESRYPRSRYVTPLKYRLILPVMKFISGFLRDRILSRR